MSREHPFTEKERQQLEKRLSAATGFVELSFAPDGTLNLGNREFLNASTNARKLIESVVDSKDSFTLENAPNSSSVAFAQIEETADYTDAAGAKHHAWNIRLDLTDFTRLRGSGKAMEAFSPVMVLFHELGHGQLRLRDNVSELDPLGECESYINRIRAELGLPLRESYIPKSRNPLSTEVTVKGEQAEFRFTKTQYLSFDLQSVCTICVLRVH